MSAFHKLSFSFFPFSLFGMGVGIAGSLYIKALLAVCIGIYQRANVIFSCPPSDEQENLPKNLKKDVIL